jgi:predicted nucleic-acid-binding protein
MIGVDTNVVIRLVTEDDPPQALKAQQLFERESVFLTKSVLLESEGVLRSLYGFERSQIAQSFDVLLGLPNVYCEDADDVKNAIEWTRQGMDFADAMHLTSAKSVGSFATFDRKLAKRATNLSELVIVEL